MSFPVKIIQVENGKKLMNDENTTDKIGRFQKIAKSLGIEIKRTRQYSLWQNGKVKCSHREDGKIRKQI